MIPKSKIYLANIQLVKERQHLKKFLNYGKIIDFITLDTPHKASYQCWYLGTNLYLL